jgi:hypothetical protein
MVATRCMCLGGALIGCNVTTTATTMKHLHCIQDTLDGLHALCDIDPKRRCVPRALHDDAPVLQAELESNCHVKELHVAARCEEFDDARAPLHHDHVGERSPVRPDGHVGLSKEGQLLQEGLVPVVLDDANCVFASSGAIHRLQGADDLPLVDDVPERAPNKCQRRLLEEGMNQRAVLMQAFPISLYRQTRVNTQNCIQYSADSNKDSAPVKCRRRAERRAHLLCCLDLLIMVMSLDSGPSVLPVRQKSTCEVTMLRKR